MSGMKPYELVYISSSDIGLEEADNIKKTIETFIQERQGVVLASEKTTPQMLAYPVKKKTSGHYTVLQFQIEESAIKELTQKISKESNILRHFLVVKKPVKQKKQRRASRKPLVPETKASRSLITPSPEKSAKVELADIDKKLDEILGE